MKKYKIQFNGKIYEVEVEELPSDYKIEKKDNTTVESKKVTKSVENSGSTGKEEIKAPMPGKILNINVSAGEEVKEGQVLLILEAMKLENEIVSPRDGKIASINTEKGSAVELNDILMTLE